MASDPESALQGIAILGAGLAGLAAARRLRAAGVEAEVYEAEAEVGGRARSTASDGCTFDQGPHVSFTRNEAIKALLAAAGPYSEKQSVLLNRWRQLWLKQPVQCHMFGLPPEIVEDCIVSFAEGRPVQTAGAFASYAQWCEAGLGKAISETFTHRYTRKYWTTEAQNMTADWVGGRVYRPSLREMVAGALRDTPADQHYITHFRYPVRGGFGAYVAALEPSKAIHLEHRLVEVDFRKRALLFANGRRCHYQRLISSLPLPDLIECDAGAPQDVHEAARELSCTSVELVDVGSVSRDGLPAAHWMYFYDEDIAFARANLPHLIADSNAPPGRGSVQVEIYHSKYRPLAMQDVLGKAVDDLVRAGVVPSKADIVFAKRRSIRYANVLYDHPRERARSRVLEYLRQFEVEICGRYGEWAYLWSDQAIESGTSAAERMLDAREWRRHIEANE